VRRESAAEANRPDKALLNTTGAPAGKECDES
jgi:hypothetical protein